MRPALRVMARPRTRAILGCCILAILLSIAPLGVFTQNQHPQIRDDVKVAKIKYARGLSPSVRKVRKMLQDARVPLEATDLFSSNWYRKVSTYSSLVPDLTRTRTRGDRLKGVEVADTLVLPEKVVLDGDTLIIARQLIFSGKHVVIKGNHDLHFFPSAPILSTNDGVQAREFSNGLRFQKAGFSPAKSIESAIQQGLLVKPESVSISVDGYGRDEWLEDQKTKKQKKPAGFRAAHVLDLAFQQSNDGADKTGEGTKGDDGTTAGTPGQANPGNGGNCAASHPDGYIGQTGTTPSQAGRGGTGGPGGDAEAGHILTYKVNSGDPFMTFSARGGQGQKGGRGGDGGLASVGGRGGNGGPGAECNCPGQSGTGGQGGRGGTGGQGGNGGDGGKGGSGGNGGTINLLKPCDYTNYGTNVNAGVRGPGGDPGHYVAGGAGGQPGGGGAGATNSYCALLGGGTGPGNSTGDPGPAGDYDGDAGQSGTTDGISAGNVNANTYGNCGGGGGGSYTDISPSGYGDGCTNYDYVQIHCDYFENEEEARLSQKYAPTVKANHYVRSLLGNPTVGWECYEVDRWYAGCY